MQAGVLQLFLRHASGFHEGKSRGRGSNPWQPTQPAKVHIIPHAALKGLELLGRHLAMFTDKTIHRTTIEDLTDAEIDAKLADYDTHKTPKARTTH